MPFDYKRRKNSFWNLRNELGFRDYLVILCGLHPLKQKKVCSEASASVHD